MVSQYAGPVALIFTVGLVISTVVLYVYHHQQQTTLAEYGTTLTEYDERLDTMEEELNSDETEIGSFLKLDTTVTAASTYTFPNVGTTANVVMTEGDQTVNGLKKWTEGTVIGDVGNAIFDQYHHTVENIEFSGPWASPISVPVQFVRIGKMAFMLIEAISTATVAAPIAFEFTVPIAFRPVSTFFSAVVSLLDDNHVVVGVLIYNTLSFVATVYKYNGTEQVAFSGSGATGIACQLAYMVN
jgi:hypothetical protein